ncbi:MAG: hypothetical protein AAGH15_04185 [Myxococcota bacterium]
MRFLGALALACCAAGGLGMPRGVRAHARPPALRQLLVDPSNPDRLVAQATWGLATSEDGGATWRWTCAAAYDVDPTGADPRVALIDGSIHVASFGGVRTSAAGCDWTPTVETQLAPDVVPLPDNGDALVLTSETAADGLARWSATGGVTPLFEAPGDLRLDRVVFAAGDPSRLYIGARVPLGPMRERALVMLASVDGGRSFEEAVVPRVGEEYRLLADAVDPDDPERVYAHALNFDGEMAPERVLRSADGGRTFEEVLGVPQVGALLALPGGVVWVGSRLGGLWRSEDRGERFTRVADVSVHCLTATAEELFVCTDQARDGFALGRRVEGAVTPLLELSAIRELAACPTCSQTGVICPGWFPDVVQDLEIPPEEVGLTEADLPGDAGTGAPREVVLPFECGGPGPPPSEGGCAAGGGPVPYALVVGLLVVGRVRRRAMRERNSVAPRPS